MRALLGASEASGFSSFLSLLGSDTTVTLGHFTTFLLTLLEYLPAVEAVTVLGLVAVFLASLKIIGESFRRLPAFADASFA